jgi:hypothetical protein
MKTYEGVEVQPREKAAGTQWIGGCMGPETGVEAVEMRQSSCLYRKSKPGYLPVVWLLCRLTQQVL